MEDKIISLFEAINFIGFDCTYQKKNNYVEKAKDLMPRIQEFAGWFLEGNQFGIEEELYYALQGNLLDILKDIMTALKEQDRVLMLDAVENGIGEYLKMFLPENYFEEKRREFDERAAAKESGDFGENVSGNSGISGRA